MNTPQIKVIEVKEPPTMKNPAIQQGIRDKATAQSWGEKNGHTVVYFIAKKQRVYAERLLTKVDVQAGKIEQASVELTIQAENIHKVIEAVKSL